MKNFSTDLSQLTPSADVHRSYGMGPTNFPLPPEKSIRLNARRGIKARRGITGLAAVAALINLTASTLAYSVGAQPLWLHCLIAVPTLYFVCICIHDCCHFMLTPYRSLTNTIGFLLSLALGIPFPLLRSSHLLHHKKFGTDEDPEAVIYNAKWWQLPIRLFRVPLYYFREWPKLSRVNQMVCVLHMSIVFAALIFGGEAILLGAVLPAILATAWFGATTVYAPHTPHAPRFMKRGTGHSGYHYEHHRNTAVPYNQYWELRWRDLKHGLSTPNYFFEEAMLELLNRPLSSFYTKAPRAP